METTSIQAPRGARLFHLTLAALAFASLALGCAPRPAAEVSGFEQVLGTACNLRLAKGGSEKLLKAGFERLHALENEISVNVDGSEIEAVNAAAGQHPVKVGQDSMAILSRDLEYSRLSDGAFDPSVGPLVQLWGIGGIRAKGSESELPPPPQIAAALAKVGWKDVVLNKEAGTAFLRRPGMALDLGSGSKGYAADLLVDLFRKGGVTSALIDLGGNIYVMGSKPDGKPWRVGLQNPDATRGTYVGVASLVDKTMVTSGVYERYFFHNGKRYHHILDTRTGYPVDNGLTSVTIITDRSFDADGLTTTLFAMGRQKGMELAKQRGVDVIMIDDQRKVYLSPGVSKYFELTDSSYTYAE
ncbi:MAG TPA: FAD:protein FMN transferase [Rectinemataceae bacterium]|nr:FAD:protein FMN transferase [Rectinemataceae bacterium]